ncbi:MAG: gamma-mobile-trio recombinase GmtY [Pseudohongiella sp.]|nr:gamma-mobile-trio recombinase GmtY [Pseudohongiella sp.]
MLNSICLQSKVTIDNTGNVIHLPVIITPEGILSSYLEYLIVNRNRSRSWIDRSSFALRLLIDYTKQNEGCFEKPPQLFREFANALYTGTVGEDGGDQSWLRWKPRAEKDAAFLIGLITHYTDWLAIQNEDRNLQINPLKKPTSYEQWMSLAAHYQKKERAFLSHLWATHPEPSAYRQVMARRKSVSAGTESTKSFPEGRITDLLWDGFVRYGFEMSDGVHERLDLKNVLITMLMHYGGLRLSECLQIWVEDVTPWDDGTALVKVFHPALGKCDAKSPKRREELLMRFGLKPRFEYPKSHSLHAGWKDPAESNSSLHYFVVYWFPHSMGKTFNDLWRLYLTYQRISDGDHPFAFTTRSGAPLSIKGFNQALKRAVGRIHLPFSKEAGTSAHAHRHAYGQALANAGADSLIIRNAMHHKSIESQQVYTRLTEKQMRHHLVAINRDNTGIEGIVKRITNDE